MEDRNKHVTLFREFACSDRDAGLREADRLRENTPLASLWCVACTGRVNSPQVAHDRATRLQRWACVQTRARRRNAAFGCTSAKEKELACAQAFAQAISALAILYHSAKCSRARFALARLASMHVLVARLREPFHAVRRAQASRFAAAAFRRASVTTHSSYRCVRPFGGTRNEVLTRQQRWREIGVIYRFANQSFFASPEAKRYVPGEAEAAQHSVHNRCAVDRLELLTAIARTFCIRQEAGRACCSHFGWRRTRDARRDQRYGRKDEVEYAHDEDSHRRHPSCLVGCSLHATKTKLGGPELGARATREITSVARARAGTATARSLHAAAESFGHLLESDAAVATSSTTINSRERAAFVRAICETASDSHSAACVVCVWSSASRSFIIQPGVRRCRQRYYPS